MQLLGPVRLQRLGDELVVGVDAQVSALGQIGLVAGTFNLLSADPVGFLSLFSQFLLDSERDLQRKRRDRVHQECADGLVDAEAGLTLADRRCVLAVLTLAGVDGPELVTALLVADAHRHTHATELVNAGVSLATIRKRLGHPDNPALRRAVGLRR